MSGDDGQRPVTPRRRQVARAQGQVARSRELVFALVYATGVVAMIAGAAYVLKWGGTQIVEGIQLAGDADRRAADLLPELQGLLVRVLSGVGAVGLVLCAVIVAAHWLQHGPIWLPSKVIPTYDRIDPAIGVRRLFGKGVLGGLFISLVRSALVGAVAVLLLLDQQAAIWQLAREPVQVLATRGVDLFSRLAAWVGLALVISASLDFGLQLWRHERFLQQSPEDPRPEVRAIRNDLQHRGRRD